MDLPTRVVITTNEKERYCNFAKIPLSFDWKDRSSWSQWDKEYITEKDEIWGCFDLSINFSEDKEKFTEELWGFSQMLFMKVESIFNDPQYKDFVSDMSEVHGSWGTRGWILNNMCQEFSNYSLRDDYKLPDRSPLIQEVK